MVPTTTIAGQDLLGEEMGPPRAYDGGVPAGLADQGDGWSTVNAGLLWVEVRVVEVLLALPLSHPGGDQGMGGCT